MRTKTIRVLLAGVVIAVGATGPARATSPASPTGVVGSGTVIVPCHQYPDYGILAPVYDQVDPACPDGTKPVVLTIAAADGRAYVSLCDPGTSYCVHILHDNPPLWPISMHCSIVVDGTWYGLILVDRSPYKWWTLKVIDGGLEGGDRFGAELTHRPGNGPCRARDVKTRPVLAGDYQVMTAR